MTPLATIFHENGSVLAKLFTSEKVFRKDCFFFHKHTDFELSLILDGRGVYVTDRGKLPIGKGDIFLFKANEQHCISDAENLSLFNIHFSPRFFWDELDSSAVFLDIFHRQNAAFGNRIAAETPAGKEAGEWMKCILTEAEKQESHFPQAIRGELYLMLIHLYRQSGLNIKAEGALPGKESLQKIGLAIDFIDSHYLSPITLSDIAYAAHLSRTYFSSLFKATYGMSCWDYIHIKRIDKAKKLLRQSEDTALSVALQCGFNNTANFNRVFKAITSTTPQEYRKADRKGY